MNQRHKDIIKRLREYDYYGQYIVSCSHSYGAGEMGIIISVENSEKEIMNFGLRDLLAIVRNVDIEPSRCVETLPKELKPAPLPEDRLTKDEIELFRWYMNRVSWKMEDGSRLRFKQQMEQDQEWHNGLREQYMKGVDDASQE